MGLGNGQKNLARLVPRLGSGVIVVVLVVLVVVVVVVVVVIAVVVVLVVGSKCMVGP